MLGVQRQLSFQEEIARNNMSSRQYKPTLQISQHSITYPSYKHGYLHQSSSEFWSSCSYSPRHKKP